MHLEGSSNVRDLGGLPLVGGGETAYGVLYRSDTLQELTPRDADLWRERGLGLVVDLRAPTEAAVEGRGPLVDAGEVRYVNAPVLSDEAMARPDEELIVHDRTPEQRAQRYLDYLDGDGGAALAGAVVALATAEAPALFHCAAGKDRTGVLAALVGDVVGVEREALVEDYALTSERIDAIIARLRRLPTYTDDMSDTAREHHLAQPEVMRLLLAGLDERHGGARRWLSSRGVDGAVLDRLAARLHG